MQPEIGGNAGHPADETEPGARYRLCCFGQLSHVDIAAVVEVLRSDWLTTGPKVDEFEHAIASFTRTADSVVVNSGTAALHCAVAAAGIGPGDEVIVPSITFAATANCVVYRGGTPVFADVEPELFVERDHRVGVHHRQRDVVVAADAVGGLILR